MTSQFQWKYALFLLASQAGAMIIFISPVLYFLSQNYQIFYQLSYNSAPELLDHLERELVWLKSFAVISLISISGFGVYLALRMTGQLLKPLLQIHRHMQRASQGDLSQPLPLRTQSEDFFELIDSYSYLYQSMQAQTRAELDQLERLKVDAQDRESQAVLRSL